MRMNLYLRINGHSVELWQTPTYITNMCLMTSKGLKPKVTGKQAARALNCYFEWCKYCNLRISKGHIGEIKELVTNESIIEVYEL
jgi:hypothetical protein